MDDDTDEKDDSKRKSRNLSEKKRRDQFNLLVNELSSMVSSTNRKMDKSTVLKSTIAFLKHHNEVAVRSRVHEIQEDWKPSFLSNEEFTHLILEALDGFIMVFSSSGRIFYASESITSLLGHLPSDLLNMTIYDLAYEEDHSKLYNTLLNPISIIEPCQNGLTRENQVTFTCYLKRGGLDYREDSYELVQFVGYFRSDVDIDNMLPNTRVGCYSGDADDRLIFVGTGRIQTPQLIREMSIVDSSKSEFTSRHSLEWKFLFLDHRAPPIIGYLPFEVLGTSGYDYYHFDDLEKVILCHEALMQKGEGKSCYYRFLTKGQQWIWLQTRFYITYHQWNSKPEFVVCTHRVVSHADVMKQLRNNNSGSNLTSLPTSSVKEIEETDSIDRQIQSSSSMVPNSPWSSKSSRASRFGSSPTVKGRSRHSNYHGNGSDSTSMSADSVVTQLSTVGSFHQPDTIKLMGPPPPIQPRSRIRHHVQNQHKMSPHPHPPQSIPPNHMTNPMSTAQLTHLHNRNIPTTAVLGPPYMEPPQYIAAIPVQPVLAPPFPPTVVSHIVQDPHAEALASGVVMNPTQSQIHVQLQRKHEELEQLINKQKEELRLVREQLLMAGCGLLPSIVNVPMSFPNTTNNSRSITNSVAEMVPQHQQQLVHPSQLSFVPGQLPNVDMQRHQTLESVDQQRVDVNNLGPSVSSQDEEMISYMHLTPVPISHLHQMRIPSDGQNSSQGAGEQQPQQQPQQPMQMQPMSISNDLEVLPYQMSQEQSQILFNAPNSPRQN